MSERDLKKIEIMQRGGEILSAVLKALVAEIKPGARPSTINLMAGKLIAKKGARPAFRNYRAPGSKKLFPADICLSLNEVIVHGLPQGRALKEDDVIKIDLGLSYGGYCVDAATTVYLGREKRIIDLLRAVRSALLKATAAAKPGNTLGDIGFVIDSTISKSGFKTIKNLCGHAISKKLHEKPDVPNFGAPHQGKKLLPGMTIAIEPMASIGADYAVIGEDGSFKTADGSPSAHFEATVAIGDTGPIILTPII